MYRLLLNLLSVLCDDLHRASRVTIIALIAIPISVHCDWGQMIISFCHDVLSDAAVNGSPLFESSPI